MRHRRCLWPWWVILVMFLVSDGLLSDGADAVERERPLRIGVLAVSWGLPPYVEGMRDGLLKLGYQEKEQFVLRPRLTQGDTTALPVAARELVQDGVDLIFVLGNQGAKAAQAATTRIPIVFVEVDDPVGSGLVQSYSHPGGNITGVTERGLALGPKRLELFREIIPGLKRVLFPYDATDVYAVAEAKMYRDTAHRFGLVLMEKPIRTVEEARATLAEVRKDEVDGILAPQCCSFNLPGFVLEATAQRGIPTMFRAAFWVEDGAFASYGPDEYNTGRQTAHLVDKILKGTLPAALPVETSAHIELAINLKVAKALGLSIAPEVLYRANKIVR